MVKQTDMQTSNRATRVVELRAMGQDGDTEQVLALYAEVFGRAYARGFQSRWRWAFRDNLRAEDTRLWVLATGGRVVGFLAAMPLPYTIAGERIIAHSPCDYMVHPDFRFHGIKLMRQLFKECPNTVTCDDIEATIKVTRWLGAREIGPVTTYMKLLDVRALARKGRFTRLPRFTFGVITRALKVVDTVLFLNTPRVRLERVDVSDERFDRLFQRLSGVLPAAVAKDRAFLAWRYGPNSPQRDAEIVAAVDRSGAFLGYAVLYLASKPSPAGYVLDLLALPEPGHGTEKALLKYAAQRLWRMGALTMRYHALPSLLDLPEGMLKGLGFRVRKGGRRVLMAKLDNERLASIAADASNWRYNLGDAEVSHSLE